MICIVFFIHVHFYTPQRKHYDSQRSFKAYTFRHLSSFSNRVHPSKKSMRSSTLLVIWLTGDVDDFMHSTYSSASRWKFIKTIMIIGSESDVKQLALSVCRFDELPSAAMSLLIAGSTVVCSTCSMSTGKRIRREQKKSILYFRRIFFVRRSRQSHTYRINSIAVND